MIEFRPGELAFNRRLGKTVRIHTKIPRGNGQWNYAFVVVDTGEYYRTPIERSDLQPSTVLEYIALDQDPPYARFLTRTGT